MAEADPFARVRLLMGAHAVAAFAHARVAVFGLGGVGGWCAEALVRSGVGSLLLVDDDRVVPSNLNRQVPALSSTLGRFKVDVLAERLRDINPSVAIEARSERYTPESAVSFGLASFDCVVDAIDSVRCKAHLIRAAVDAGVTLFSSMGAAARVDISRIKATPFRKVAGDGLAKALRRRFKEDGWTKLDFMCVWSDEPPSNLGERMPEDGTANGSFMPVTAAFGLHLASLVLSSVRSAAAESRGISDLGGRSGEA